MNHMKSTAFLLHAALGALLILPAHGTMDEFLKNSPLGKDRLEAERVLRLDAGSLNNAQSKSGMEVAGNGKLEDVDFVKRIHFSKGKPSGYEWYADGDPVALERAWITAGDALSKAFGASPLVTVPQERLGELSPSGETSGKLKCWSNPNHALCAFLEISGRKAYLVFGQYDLQAEGIPLLDDTGTSDYLRGLLGKQSGKLPDLWKAGEAGVLSPAIEEWAFEAAPKGKQSKPGETTEFSPAWNSDAMNMARERERRVRRFDRDFTAADYVPEAPGRISKRTAWNLNRHAALALEDLERVPDGEKGKGLSDHALLKQMALDLQAVAVSMYRNELIQLIPRLLALDSMDKEYDEVLCVRWQTLRFPFARRDPRLCP
jgi:hypothetical protein